jgi:hypothetical protein
MRSYDASYGADAGELEKAAAETIQRHLNPTLVPTKRRSSRNRRGSGFFRESI